MKASSTLLIIESSATEGWEEAMFATRRQRFRGEGVGIIRHSHVSTNDDPSETALPFLKATLAKGMPS